MKEFLNSRGNFSQFVVENLELGEEKVLPNNRSSGLLI